MLHSFLWNYITIFPLIFGRSFQIVLKAWRKALVEGPPRAPKILALEEHMR